MGTDSSGNAYIVGSGGASFPTTAGAYQTTNTAGSVDAFVMKLSSGASPPPGDSTSPTVSITSPSGTVWTGNSINISASASDNVGLNEIKIWGNGGVIGTITCSGTSCTGSVLWITGPLPPGQYGLFVEVSG